MNNETPDPGKEPASPAEIQPPEEPRVPEPTAGNVSGVKPEPSVAGDDVAASQKTDEEGAAPPVATAVVAGTSMEFAATPEGSHQGKAAGKTGASTQRTEDAASAAHSSGTGMGESRPSRTGEDAGSMHGRTGRFGRWMQGPVSRSAWIAVLVLAALSVLLAAPAFTFWSTVQSIQFFPGWMPTLLMFILSGALGGMLGPLQLPDVAWLMGTSEQSHFRRARIWNFLAAEAVSAAGGIGGAMALLFVMLLADKIGPNPPRDRDFLVYITSGVLSGFLGFQLLKVIAANLLKNLGILQDSAKEAERKAIQFEHRSQLRSAILQGLFDYNEQETARPHHIEESIAELERLLPEFPGDRRAIIVLANLLGHSQRNYAKAIDVLNAGLKVIEASPNVAERTQDRADILYNRACYYALQAALFESFKDDRTRAEANRYRSLALRDLKQSLEFDPRNADFAAGIEASSGRKARERDTDFDAIRPEGEFTAMITAARAKYL